MTRTYIIAADGTRYVPVTSRARIRNRIIAALAAIIALPFILAALIGVGMAITGNAPADAAPRASHTATASKATTLTVAGAEKACKGSKKHTRQWGSCINLYMRHAWKDTQNYTPEGRVLVKDCISQYRGIELTYCFEQEIG